MSFRQKYRVFSSAYWLNNSNNFDLEKSDKIVLPPSALNVLSKFNASFPILLKIEPISMTTNKTIPGNYYSYVIDFSAANGLIYMSSWMIKKLNLDPSGKSIVELSLPTKNNLKYQCPTADFIQFQPESIEFMYIPKFQSVVKKSLETNYSTLRVDDSINCYYNNKKYKLNVTKISTKDTNYTPKCVTLKPYNNDSNNADNLMLGFLEPNNFDLNSFEKNNNNNNNNNVINIQNNQNEKKEEDDIKDNNNIHENNDNQNETVDDEWEIVSVEKVKSLPDNYLQAQQPSQPPSQQQQQQNDNDFDPIQINEYKESQNDDKDININQPNQPNQANQNNDDNDMYDDNEIDIDSKEQHNLNNNNKNKNKNDNNNNNKEIQPKKIENKNNQSFDLLDDIWICVKCSASNDKNFFFCPKCGNKNQPPKANHNNNQPQSNKKSSPKNKNGYLLKMASIISEGKYEPCEERQTGWIVQNISGKKLYLEAQLKQIGGDSDVTIDYENMLEISLKENEQMFVLIDLRAPPIPNTYHVFCQLIEPQTNKKICEALKLPVHVINHFDNKKEEQIKFILRMGFKDRTRVIKALKKWNWDQLKAVNWLVTHPQ